ncbi:DUF998 domain-containing protein [Jannaschia sp. CCS1]|uniref:DUF998 domain-containing protein n=1 Tax=Jannaschia sp. (strain CCS1) TaxID=290400 RepID=UPI000053C3D2|nr:DUF998 domain-containing protein [Jannaschia sp. CCS1]ABD53510.1 hypothetical protein Jann_0593 [Jannaschia sp. CCS1]
MDDMTGHDLDAERPYFLIVLGAFGIIGCIIGILGVIVAQAMVPGHDWIADTISDLGAGENEIIMDVALYAFAAGIFAVALCAAHTHLGGVGWSGGVVILALLAAAVVVIGARNEYGDGDNEGVVVHIYVVYALGVGFFAAPLLLANGFGRDPMMSRRWLIGLAILWAAASPVFFFLPTSVDGLYERGLGLIACAIISLLGWMFVVRGRRAL